MKSAYRLMMAFCLLAVLGLAGVRLNAGQTGQGFAPAFHQMVAEGDIGDGTSPSKKG